MITYCIPKDKKKKKNKRTWQTAKMAKKDIPSHALHLYGRMNGMVEYRCCGDRSYFRVWIMDQNEQLSRVTKYRQEIIMKITKFLSEIELL